MYFNQIMSKLKGKIVKQRRGYMSEAFETRGPWATRSPEEQ